MTRIVIVPSPISTLKHLKASGVSKSFSNAFRILTLHNLKEFSSLIDSLVGLLHLNELSATDNDDADDDDDAAAADADDATIESITL